MYRLAWLSIIGLLWAEAPCDHCQDAPICLGSCAYELLLKAETPMQKSQAQIILGKAWVLGGFQQGAISILHEVLSKMNAESGMASYHEALYWLGQAHQTNLNKDSAQFYYQRLGEDPRCPPYWKSKALLSLAGLLSEKSPLSAQTRAAEALEAAKAAQDPELEALALNQLSVFLSANRQYERALAIAQKAVSIARQLAKPRLLTATLTNLATLYDDLREPREALPLYHEALQLAPDSLSQAHALLNLANHYYTQRQDLQAEKVLNQLQSILLKLPLHLRTEYYRLRAYMAIDRRQMQEVARFLEAALEAAVRAVQEVETNRIAQLEQLSGLRMREAQLTQLQISRSRERTLYIILAGIGVLALGGAVYAYLTARRRAREEVEFRQQIEVLNQRLTMQSQQVERQNHELTRISEALAEALQDLQDSISAAERLQKALMPPLEKIFSGAVAYYQPLQQVGGDFYIVAHDVLSGYYLVAVGDATGHGISGSILASIFGATMQNFFLQNPTQSVRGLLQRVHAFTGRLLAARDSEGAPIREGCDIALLLIDPKKESVEVGLAGRPVWVWDSEKGLQELEGGRRGIDSFTPQDYEFPTYTLPLHPRQIFYLFTDGLTDVLNPEGKKWGSKRLRELVSKLNNQNLVPKTQLQTLLDAAESWRQNTLLNDDVTLIILPGEQILRKATEKTLQAS